MKVHRYLFCTLLHLNLLSSIIGKVDFPKTCGVSTLASRIVGGSKATPRKWPWIVSIQISGKHICTGSLIHEQLVIMAAHCLGIGGHLLRTVTILAGALNLKNKHIRRIKVAKVLNHADFGHKNEYFLNADIGLLELECPVPFVKEPKAEFDLHPICMSPVGKSFEGANCFVAGWGSRYDGGPAVVDLRELRVKVHESYSTCQEIAKPWNFTAYDKEYRDKLFRINPNSQICTKSLKTKDDSCHGDSGGPLICQDGSKWYLHGVTSFNSFCDGKGTVYTKIAYYLKWIAKQKYLLAL